jgi:hypothetical protein
MHRQRTASLRKASKNRRKSSLLRVGMRFTRKSGIGLRERREERRHNNRRNSTDPLQRLSSDERRRQSDFQTSKNRGDNSSGETALRRQSSREMRPARRSISNLPADVGTRVLSRNRLRRNSTRRLSQQSRDWEFELNYQLKYAKSRKIQRKKETDEMKRMKAAEDEQCANGFDSFWGIDSMMKANANGARAAQYAAADAVIVGKHVMATIHTMLAWVKRGKEMKKDRGYEMRKQREETRRKYMREFWAATVASRSRSSNMTTMNTSQKKKKNHHTHKKNNLDPETFQRELKCLEADTTFPRCVLGSMRSGISASRGRGF